jgi:hypothetical protein
MGKAQIISGGSAGLYNIGLVRDTARITAEIAAITARLAALTTAIEEAEAARNDALDAVNDALAALNTAITDLINKQTTAAAVSDLQKAHATAQQQYSAKYSSYNLLILERESKTKRLALLQEAITSDSRTGIWCADLTENLAAGAEVGTIEINGEDTQIIIYPAGALSALQSSLLQPVLSSTPAGVFYNQAILPAWQRWKPTYRTATITAIDGDLCSVLLSAALSSQQDLNINPSVTTLTNVPIEYMDGLNGSVFAVGDRVVVEFTDQDWASPKVIGFETNPRSAVGTGKFFIFYVHGGIHKVANCTIDDNRVINHQSKSFADIGITGEENYNYVRFFSKKFYHNVKKIVDPPPSGEEVPPPIIELKELYFVSTNLKLSEATSPLEYSESDPFSWLVGADLSYITETTTPDNWYIIDPALRRIYLLGHFVKPTDGVRGPFQGRWNYGYQSEFINFSADNNYMYHLRTMAPDNAYPWPSYSYTRHKYSFLDNNVTVAETIKMDAYKDAPAPWNRNDYIFYLNREGTLVYESDVYHGGKLSLLELASKDGYYDGQFYDLNSGGYDPDAWQEWFFMIPRELGNLMYSYYTFLNDGIQSYYVTPQPWQEIFEYDENDVPRPWASIHDGDVYIASLLLQAETEPGGFPERKRMYYDTTDILPLIKIAVDISDELNLLGLAYLA